MHLGLVGHAYVLPSHMASLSHNDLNVRTFLRICQGLIASAADAKGRVFAFAGFTASQHISDCLYVFLSVSALCL